MVNQLSEASPEQAEALFTSLKETQFAGLLVGTFKAHTDPETWMMDKSQIIGNVEVEGIEPSMRLYNNYGNVVLEIYDWSSLWIPESRFAMVGSADVLAEITCRPAQEGVWAYGRGNARKWVIDVRCQRGIILPTKHGKWLFSLLSEFSMKASEHYDPLSEQPIFWDGKGERA